MLHYTLFLQIKRQEGSSLIIPVIILSPLFLIFRFYLCNHLPGIFQLPYHSELLMQLDNTTRILKNKCSFVYLLKLLLLHSNTYRPSCLDTALILILEFHLRTQFPNELRTIPSSFAREVRLYSTLGGISG